MGLDDFRGELSAAIGADRVFEGGDRYATDWTGRYSAGTCLVVRPSNTEQVAEVVRAAARHGVALVPQGGNTGLVGGGVPHRGEVVVSLESMRQVGPVDVVSRQLTAEAGATLQQVQEAAVAAELRYPVDFGARGSATIGGTVATNAGGINVLRYGMTRHQIVGIEAVLGSGEIISRLTGLVKDNTGYDFVSLLCGSEGTLGVVTKVRLRLVPVAPHRCTFLAGVPDLATAMACVTDLTRNLDTIDAVELMMANGLRLVSDCIGLPVPIADHSVYLLIEASSEADQTEAIGRILATRPGVEVVSAATAQQRRDLWRLRDEHTPSINMLGPPAKFDVTVPLRAIPRFVPEVHRLIEERHVGSTLVIFGHAADGNLHVNVIGVESDDLERLGDDVLGVVASFDGSVSAEHGIGVTKKRWLHLSRSEAEIASMKAVKNALDPMGIMNPNVLFD
ncbi:MAG: hypothetical protein RL391_338 [Actinomycetota bacterium]|jgi:FAD/FMN-containing dehydrogenase